MNKKAKIQSFLNKIVNYFEDKPNIAAIYMFGSTAKDKDQPRSDIDIAVMFENYRPEKEGLSFLSYVADMEGLTEKEIDLVNYNSANPLLRHQIIKNGQLLTEKNTLARVELMVRAMIDYEEYQQYLDLGLDILRREMGEAEKSE